MIVTNDGRPAGDFPLFKWKDGEGGMLLTLSRINVSDIGNMIVAEAHYEPFFKRDARDGMETWEFHFFDTQLILFFAPRKVNVHVAKRDQETEQ